MSQFTYHGHIFLRFRNTGSHYKRDFSNVFVGFRFTSRTQHAYVTSGWRIVAHTSVHAGNFARGSGKKLVDDVKIDLQTSVLCKYPQCLTLINVTNIYAYVTNIYAYVLYILFPLASTCIPRGSRVNDEEQLQYNQLLVMIPQWLNTHVKKRYNSLTQLVFGGTVLHI